MHGLNRILQLSSAPALLCAAALLARGTADAQPSVKADKSSVAIGGSATNVRIGILPDQLPAIIAAARRPLEQQTAEQRRQIGQLERDIGASRAELDIIFRVFGLDSVPEADRIARLTEVAVEFRRLKTSVSQLPAADPLRKPAQVALAQGEFDRTAALLRASRYYREVRQKVRYSIRRDNRQVIFQDEWPDRNIVVVHVPQLQGVPFNLDRPFHGKVRINRVAQTALLAGFVELENEGRLTAVKRWCGDYIPAAVLGSNSPSPHALGLAFDINQCVTNASRADLESIAEVLLHHGFVWSGWRQGVQQWELGHFQYIGPPATAAGMSAPDVQ